MTETALQEMYNIQYDSLTLKTWLEQNIQFLQGARIQKIQQPSRREFVFTVRNNGQTQKLYVNIEPQYYHVCFTDKNNENKRLIDIPSKPPMFCMLLRKYLENSVISKVIQPKYERILELYIETYNELSEKIYLCLAIELMGKYSNVILYNFDTNIILGCAHNVSAEKSRERELSGTLPYTYPPNPPQSWYAGKDSLSNNTQPNINLRIDDYYANVINQHKKEALKNKYKQAINKRLKKHKNSLEKMSDKLASETNYNQYRLLGDLILSNLYDNKDFTEQISVYDWENNKNIIITLDNTKTLKDNANTYYKMYTKAKKADEKLSKLIEKTKKDIEYLNQIAYSMDISNSIDELKEIEEELGIKSIEKNKIKKSTMPIETEIEGHKVYIGKNNKQNDYIVSKLSKDDDYWFHIKDYAGSHVLLKCNNPTDKMIYYCAKLAKEYSVTTQSSKVSVIYTQRKNIKKPPKSNLGYVIYKNEKEIIV